MGVEEVERVLSEPRPGVLVIEDDARDIGQEILEGVRELKKKGPDAG